MLSEESIIAMARGKMNLAEGALAFQDDCAVFPKNDQEAYVISTDSLVEGIHFDRNLIPPFDLGHKSLAVSLSDLASMGAHPRYALCSINLPKLISQDWLENWMQGIASLARKFDVRMLGGDTTGSIDHMGIHITVIGDAKNSAIKYRGSARPQDKVYVTSTLGDSWAGWQLQEAAPEGFDKTHRQALIRRHHRPMPMVEQGQWLAEQDVVRAMMDLSDGLMQDLPKLLGASKQGARVQLESIPMSVAFQEYCRVVGIEFGQEVAIWGGEDYGLLFTAGADSDLEMTFREKFGDESLWEIGQITEDSGLVWLWHGGVKNIDDRSFRHFDSKERPGSSN